MWMPMPATAQVVYRVGLGREFYGLAAAILMFAAALAVLVSARRLAGIVREPIRGPRLSGARRLLSAGLGGLWVLDGLLEAQPHLVNDFGTFLRATAVGQPPWLLAWLNDASRIWKSEPLPWDLAFTGIQVGVGLMILAGAGRVRRLGLYASIVWGVMVFTLGEAFGGLLYSAGAMDGVPGAALLYAVAAALLLLPPRVWSGPGFRRGFRLGWSALFGLWFAFETWPGEGWWQGGLHSTSAAMAAMAQPPFFSVPLRAWASLAFAHPLLVNGAVSALWLALALYWGLGRVRPAGVWATALAIGFAWWMGQDFGVLGGWGTDPGTGAILLLLLATDRLNRRQPAQGTSGLRGQEPPIASAPDQERRVVSSPMEYNRPW